MARQTASTDKQQVHLSISLFFSSNMQESCKHTTDSLCRIAQDAAADDLY